MNRENRPERVRSENCVVDEIKIQRLMVAINCVLRVVFFTSNFRNRSQNLILLHKYNHYVNIIMESMKLL